MRSFVSSKNNLYLKIIFGFFLYTFFLFCVLKKFQSGGEVRTIHFSKNPNEHLYRSEIIKKKNYGPGEYGKAYILPARFDREKDYLYRANGFNARASDDIALNRSLPDIRDKRCKTFIYPEKLPSTSVIIPFFNEHWTTLLRTFISVLNRSPSNVKLEIILVDDGSDKDFLKKDLDKYIAKYPRVRVIRMIKRQGLIRARLAGAKKAAGEVLIFLDSHTECNIDWLPPLLAPIVANKRTAVCPFIDVIDYDNYEYRAQDEGARGAFDWELFYKRLPLLPDDLKNMPKPFKSPVMAGGLFAISAQFFWELGGYDSGLLIWGGEQYELSFKIWQCGGMMVDAPCSRVGHIYRKFSPVFQIDLSDENVNGPFLQRNHKRVAEVWMDEYKEYIYKRSPSYHSIDAGDLSQQKYIRKKLKCKSFKWFMENVAFDLVKHYPPVDLPHFAEGYIKSLADPTRCIDSGLKNHLERFGLSDCENRHNLPGREFQLTWRKDIRPKGRNLCWDVSSGDAQSPVLLYTCHGGKGNQLWRFDYEHKLLKHGQNGRCLEANIALSEIFVTNCDRNEIKQKWHLENVDLLRLKLWDDEDKLMNLNL